MDTSKNKTLFDMVKDTRDNIPSLYEALQENQQTRIEIAKLEIIKYKEDHPLYDFYKAIIEGRA